MLVVSRECHILKEITNSAHLDILVGLFLVLFLLFLSRFELWRGRLWLGLAAVALGMAVLSKLYPVVLIPAVLLYLFRNGTPIARIVGFITVVGLTVLVGYLPLLSREMLPWM